MSGLVGQRSEVLCSRGQERRDRPAPWPYRRLRPSEHAQFAESPRDQGRAPLGGAVLLLRAAHGRPAATVVQQTPPGVLAWGEEALDHQETLRAAKALTRGVVLTVLCAAALTATVAVTWYGPDKSKPRLEVVTPDGGFCGSPRGVTDGRLLLRTPAGEVTVRLDEALTVRAVESCPGPGTSG